MKIQKHKELAQSDKEPGFRKMAETFQIYMNEEHYLAAYVVGFSFLEDRIAAMLIERRRVDEADERKSLRFHQKIERLEKAGDLPSKLAQACLATNTQRNGLLHNAMWNLNAFSKKAAYDVYKLARQADHARATQQRKFEKAEATQ